MAVRILLVLALLLSIGAIVVGHVKVKPRILATEEQLSNTKAQLASETAAKQKVQGELTQTKATLDATKADLDKTKTELAAMTTEAENAKKLADEKVAENAKIQAEIAKVKSENKLFFDLGMSIDQIKKTVADLKIRTTERDTFTKENKVLNQQILKLRAEIVQLSPTTTRPKLPAGLAGTVTSVDPKYDFVVLDIGTKNGVISRGEMIISRGGQLVGKLEIADVESDYCYANIMKVAGKKPEVLEGDVVQVQ